MPALLIRCNMVYFSRKDLQPPGEDTKRVKQKYSVKKICPVANQLVKPSNIISWNRTQTFAVRRQQLAD
jgi:hypothetical protein